MSPFVEAGRRSKSLHIRLTRQEYKELKTQADRYAGGKLSTWIRYAIRRDPQFMSKKIGASVPDLIFDSIDSQSSRHDPDDLMKLEFLLCSFVEYLSIAKKMPEYCRQRIDAVVRNMHAGMKDFGRKDSR